MCHTAASGAAQSRYGAEADQRHYTQPLRRWIPRSRAGGAESSSSMAAGASVQQAHSELDSWMNSWQVPPCLPRTGRRRSLAMIQGDAGADPGGAPAEPTGRLEHTLPEDQPEQPGAALGHWGRCHPVTAGLIMGVGKGCPQQSWQTVSKTEPDPAGQVRRVSRQCPARRSAPWVPVRGTKQL